MAMMAPAAAFLWLGRCILALRDRRGLGGSRGIAMVVVMMMMVPALLLPDAYGPKQDGQYHRPERTEDYQALPDARV